MCVFKYVSVYGNLICEAQFRGANEVPLECLPGKLLEVL